MKKIEQLLKKAESFEKLATYGNRKSFLMALSQAGYKSFDKGSHDSMVNYLDKLFSASKSGAPGALLTDEERSVAQALSALRATDPNDVNTIKNILGYLSTNAQSPLNTSARSYLDVLNSQTSAAAVVSKPTPTPKPVVTAPKLSSQPSVAKAQKELSKAVSLIKKVKTSRKNPSFMEIFDKTYQNLTAQKLDLTRELGDKQQSASEYEMLHGQGIPADRAAKLKADLAELSKALQNVDKALVAMENAKKVEREF